MDNLRKEPINVVTKQTNQKEEQIFSDIDQHVPYANETISLPKKSNPTHLRSRLM